jgi:hypothetical protein
MIVKYSKLRALLVKDRINSTLSIDYFKNNEKSSIRGLLSFEIEDEDLLSNHDLAMRYITFKGEYYILALERDKLILYFGLKKISGTKMYLIKKEVFDDKTKGNTYSHIGFISDDLKLFSFHESFNYHGNKEMRAFAPINIENII